VVRLAFGPMVAEREVASVGSNVWAVCHPANMRSYQEYERVLSLARGGLRDGEISNATGVPARTVNGWRRGTRRGPPRGRRTPSIEPARPPWRPLEPAVYSYLLGVYFFSNRSEDILRIFADACDRVHVHTTRSNHRNLSVSRRDSVDVLDSFVGPKA